MIPNIFKNPIRLRASVADIIGRKTGETGFNNG